jgi:GNAT superfamily N-acetyltransferase
VSTPEYRFEPLGRQHDRAAFSCGDEALDRYLRHNARQHMAKNVAQVFVLVHPPTNQLAGFYTLSAFSVRATELPEAVARQLPRYPMIPATMLGRLAVDQQYRAQGIGGVLLLNALRRAREASRSVASVAVIVDAKNDQARSFYEHYDFQRFISNAYRLFLPMGAIRDV